jgi:HAD superfamily hydrolase (TIGR01509 family)
VNGGVVFDLDGVLIDSEGLWHRATNEVLKEWGKSVTAEEYGRDWIGTAKGPEFGVVHFALPIDAAEFRRRRKPIVTDLVQREARLMPGVAAAVERLAARWPLAVATNSYAAAAGPVLTRLGVRRHFRELLTRERYAAAKPAPDAYVAAAAALGVAPSSCVAIEDTPRGIESAAAAGLRTIAVPNEFTRGLDFTQADRVVASLDEVTVALVEGLVRNRAS